MGRHLEEDEEDSTQGCYFSSHIVLINWRCGNKLFVLELVLATCDRNEMSFLQIFFLSGMSPVPFQNGKSEKRTNAATSTIKPHGPWRNNIKEPLI